MMKIENVTGLRKVVFTTRMKLCLLLYYLPEMFKGKISVRRYILFLKRLLYFLSKVYHNKFVKIGSAVRPGLYIPGFPSKAFFTACRKFFVFDEKLPCTTVLISVTSACRFKCKHCYQRNDLGGDVDIDLIISAAQRLKERGVAFFNIEGGEPFLVYDRLKKLCAVIGKDAEIWVNSTGDGMTLDRLRELKQLGLTAVMFSLHSHEPQKLNAFMKSDKAWDTLVEGIRLCHSIDVPVAFNSCLMRDDFYNGNFEKLMNRAKEFNACLIQIIKPKSAGAWLESGAGVFTVEDLGKVKESVRKYNQDVKYKDYPSISAQIIEEDAAVFGCTAGGTDRFYINAKGDVQPCEFLNISFGNIAQENFDEIYNRMRSYFQPPGECWLCEKYSSEIVKLSKENNLRTLPLNKNLSQRIYANWRRGNQTEMYKQIEEKLK
ncbi:MAG: radical SAM protein [Candidatus Omnitrophica bacterium]|nr:radical SAM protein [Candidatus Omnitrophota bacterium]